MGDYMYDYPEGLFTELELEKLKSSYRYYYRTKSEDVMISELLSESSHSLRSVRWPTYYDFAQRCRLTEWPRSKWESMRSRLARLASSSDLDDDDLPGPIALYKYDFSAWFERPQVLRSYNPAKPCILRNLSKHVYIRDDILAVTEPDEADESFVYGMSFGDVVVSRIAWSCYLKLSTGQSDDSYRGIWAGDRFDIVNLDAIENEEGWIDDSPAAIKELRTIWESEYGERWVQEIRDTRYNREEEMNYRMR